MPTSNARLAPSFRVGALNRWNPEDAVRTLAKFRNMASETLLTVRCAHLIAGFIYMVALFKLLITHISKNLAELSLVRTLNTFGVAATALSFLVL